MKIQSLAYFVALVEAGSISKAARQLYLSQPSLTKTLHLLEEELETQDIEDIVNYYLTEDEEYPPKVSGRYMAKLIKKKYPQDKVKALRKAYKEEEGGELAAFYGELSVKQKNSYKKEEEESNSFGPKAEKKGKFGLFGGKW